MAMVITTNKDLPMGTTAHRMVPKLVEEEVASLLACTNQLLDHKYRVVHHTTSSTCPWVPHIGGGHLELPVASSTEHEVEAFGCCSHLGNFTMHKNHFELVGTYEGLSRACALGLRPFRHGIVNHHMGCSCIVNVTTSAYDLHWHLFG